MSAPEMRLPRLKELRSVLTAFTTSSAPFALVPTTTRNSTPPPPPKTVYILDSSFNPPTFAHWDIALSALKHDAGAEPKRLLLLLATQNADKAPKPAAFEHRLALMAIFARDLARRLSEPSAGPDKPSDAPTVDVGLTKLPYFHDKAKAIADAAAYPSDAEQVYLIGFDTLIRILDPKYYPPSYTLAPLTPFLSSHRLRVTTRTDGDWEGTVEQQKYLDDLRDGKRESEGGSRDWARRIELVDGRTQPAHVISSTTARNAASKGDEETLRRLLPAGIAQWVIQERLYLDQG